MDGERYTIEIEPEVRLWLENLPAHHYVIAEQKVDRLAGNATTLGEPYSRHLGGKLRELRFDLGDNAQRITYWIAPGRRVVLLTVFHKTKMRRRLRSSAPAPPRQSARQATSRPPNTTSTAAT